MEVTFNTDRKSFYLHIGSILPASFVRMLVLKADVIKDVFFTGDWKRFLRDSCGVHWPEVVFVESEALLYCMGPHGLVELVTTRKVQSATMELILRNDSNIQSTKWEIFL